MIKMNKRLFGCVLCQCNITIGAGLKRLKINVVYGAGKDILSCFFYINNGS